MRETVWHFAMILLITGVIFFTNLGESRLWDRDEPRNAGCAAEMMERGDWVVPMFNDELRHQKPALLYWLMMSAYSVFGVNEFSARFWSAALAVGTTLATYGIARRLTNATVGLIAAIALSSSLMFDVAARAATPDSVLIFCTTMAILIYVLGTFSKTESKTKTGAKPIHAEAWFPRNLSAVIGFYVMLGLAVLAKGPIGFLLPMTMVGLFMLVQTLAPNQNPPTASELMFAWARAKACWLLRFLHPGHFLKTLGAMRPILGASVVLLVAAPWYVLVDAQTNGDFTKAFFIGEHFGRATTVLENHSGGFWFYPLAILIGFFPWSMLWGPFVAGLFRREGDGQYPIAMSLMFCWIGVQVVVFSLAQTKLPSYVTPCYPALAILAAICLVDLLDFENVENRSRVGRGWFYAASGGLAISGAVFIGGLGFAAATHLPNQIWIAGLGLIPMFGGGLLIWLLATRQTKYVPIVFAAVAVLFSWGLFGLGTVSIDAEQQNHLLWKKMNTGSLVGSYGCLESSWVYYLGRPIHELDQTTEGKISSNGQRAEAMPVRTSFWKPKPRVSVASLLATDPNAMLITTDEYVDSLRKRLPEDFVVLQTAEYFLKNKQIYLLGRSNSIARQSSSVVIER